MFRSFSYGVLPSRETFDAAWLWIQDEENATSIGLSAGRSDSFSFGNDPRMGTCTLSQDEVWAELSEALQEYDDGSEAAGEWCSSVLYCLGIEWV